MIIKPKEISLRNDTINDINNGVIDTDKYIGYIRENLNNANQIIKIKLQSLEDIELYDFLSKVFNIEIEEKDLLRILKERYNKHYIKFTALNTRMIDSEGNNIVLIGAATKNVPNTDFKMPIATLRKLVNSYDLIVMKEAKTIPDKDLTNPEKYEDYKMEKIGVELEENDPLFAEKISLIRKDLRNTATLKKILYLVEKYIKELIFQAKSITKLGEEDEDLKEISAKYKEAFEKNFKKKEIFISGNHKKSH